MAENIITPEIKSTIEDRLRAFDAFMKHYNENIKPHAATLADLGKATSDDKTIAQKMVVDIAELNDKIKGLLANGEVPPAQSSAPLTAGKTFVDSDAYKYYAGSAASIKSTDPVKVDYAGFLGVKAVGDGEIVPLSSATLPASIKPPEYHDPVPVGRPMKFIQDIIQFRSSTSRSLYVPIQTGFTGCAAPTDELQPKPKCTIRFTEKLAQAITIACYVEGSKQCFKQASMLLEMIQGELRYSWMYGLQNQIFHGRGPLPTDGTAPPAGQTMNEILGMDRWCQTYDPTLASQVCLPGGPASTGELNIMDDILTAICQVEIAHYPAEFISLTKPAHLALMLLKDGDGRYLFPELKNGDNSRLCGLQLCLRHYNPDDPNYNPAQFYVGNATLAMTGRIVDDWSIMITDKNNDDVTRNKEIILGEGDVIVACKRPESIVCGEFSCTTTTAAAKKSSK